VNGSGLQQQQQQQPDSVRHVAQSFVKRASRAVSLTCDSHMMVKSYSPSRSPSGSLIFNLTADHRRLPSMTAQSTTCELVRMVAMCCGEGGAVMWGGGAQQSKNTRFNLKMGWRGWGDEGKRVTGAGQQQQQQHAQQLVNATSSTPTCEALCV